MNVSALSLNQSNQEQNSVLDVLGEVHIEAALDASNAHKSAASSASLLLVKVLLKAGVDVKVMVDVYSETRARCLTYKQYRIQPAFFTDWNNWCAQARSWLAK